MTTFYLHPLNARHALTPVLSELRTAVRDAVTRASDHAAIPDFDLVVRADAGAVLTGGRSAGHAPAPGLIEMTIDPARLDPNDILRALVHEMHHLIRWDGPGYGKSLGEALVSEGLAGHFVLEVAGGSPDPWDAVTPSADLIRRAGVEWARQDYDHGEWFLGRGKVRKWSGYGLGHRLIAEYLAQSPGETAASLAQASAETFRPAMRRLAAADAAGDEAAP